MHYIIIYTYYVILYVIYGTMTCTIIVYFNVLNGYLCTLIIIVLLLPFVCQLDSNSINVVLWSYDYFTHNSTQSDSYFIYAMLCWMQCWLKVVKCVVLFHSPDGSTNPTMTAQPFPETILIEFGHEIFGWGNTRMVGSVIDSYDQLGAVHNCQHFPIRTESTNS